MFRSFKVQKKIFAIWSLFSLILNMAQPALLALTFAPPAYAQVATESADLSTPNPEPSIEPSASPIESAVPSPEPSIAPSIEPTPTLSPEPSASPSSEATITPSPSIEPSIVPSSTPTPAPTSTPSNPEPSQDSSPAPPSAAPIPTPAPTPQPELNEQLSITVVDHTSASSIEEFDLEVTETGSATLATDKADYAPTDTALITGTSFLANTTYSLTISSTDDPATSTTIDVTTDESGALFYAYQLDGTYRPNYKVEAFLGSSLVAMITFTDASGASANLDQYDNYGAGIGWQNGNLNQNDAKYREGDSVPYRFVMSDIGAGSHTLIIEWDTLKSGKHALDYLTTFNRTVVTANPCTGIAGCGSPTTFPIPSQPGTVNQIPGNFTIYNGTITSVSGYTFSGADNAAQIAISFTATSATPVIAVGGHIGSQFDWGLDNAAGAVPGSPYHMRLISIDGGGGNQDRSLAAGAVYPVPNITTTASSSSTYVNQGVTDTAVYTAVGQNGNVTGTTNFFVCGPDVSATACTTGGTQVGGTITNSSNQAISATYTPTQTGYYCFRAEYTPDATAQYSPINHTNNTTECFNVTNPPQGSLTVTKNVINDNGGSLTASNFPLFVGTTRITSGATNTFAPATYTLSETSQTGYTQTSIVCDSGKTNPVILNNGDDVHCTITNDDDPPSLTLTKQVIIDDGGTAVAGDWTLTAIGYDPSTPQIGTYNLSESIGPDGYALTSLTCDNATGQVSSVTLGLGEDVTCTFINDDQAPTLTLIKTISNDNGGDLQVAEVPLFISGSPAVSGTAYELLANVTYTASETNQTGYLASLWGGDCATDGTITLLPGDNKTCTITNDDIAPVLTFLKRVNNDYGGILGVSDFPLFINGNSVTSGTPNILFANFLYILTETQQAGYAGGDFSGDCSSDGTITLNPGDDKTCTITNNDQPGTLIVNKVIVGSDSDASEFSFEVNDRSAVDFESDGQNSLTVDAGTYSVVETEISGYDTSYDNCDDLLIVNNGSATCTITNTKLGSISGHKAEDQDGLLTTTDDLDDVNGWGMSLYKWDGESFVDTGLSTQTDQNGDYIFEDLLPGTYEVVEETKTDWTPLSPTSGTIEVIVGAGDNKTGNDFINSDERKITFCHATASEGNPFVTITTSTSAVYNAHLGDQESHQWGEDIIPPFTFDGETYSQNWDAFGQATYRNGCNNDVYGSITISKTITPDNFEQSFTFNLGGDATDSAEVMGGSSHTFTDLLPGSYDLTEIMPSGWSFDYAFCGDEETYVPGETLTLSAAQDLSCTFHNIAVEPELSIQKSNDAAGSKNPGDIVTYTIVIDLGGSALSGVTVTDVMPDGFDYVPGSWTADKNGSPLIIPEPNYASPGTWNLGEMESGDVITLTHQTKISSDQDAGTYTDLARAEGNSPTWGTTLALGHDSAYVEDIFVGTDVAVNKSIQQTGTVNIERDGEVLGASTSLPATGTSTIWLLLTLTSLLSGLFLIFGGKRMKFLSTFFLAGFMLLSYQVPSALAVENISVRLEQPTTPTRVNDWKLSYAVLDRLERTPSVTCYVKKPGTSSFTQFDITHPSSKPSGDNGNCQVNSSVISAQGIYDFKVVASATTGVSESKESKIVSVAYDTDGPSTPTSYSKERPSQCRWIIKFHTASDSGLTTKVEIYSSDQRNFDTNPSSRVGTVNLGSNQDGEFIHDRANNCDREWYYVIRAFDSVGNQSGHIGDSVVKITASSTPAPSTTPALVVASANNGSILGKEDDSSELGETSTPSPESVEATGLVEGVSDALKSAPTSKKLWWILDILAIVVIIYVIFLRRASHS